MCCQINRRYSGSKNLKNPTQNIVCHDHLTSKSLFRSNSNGDGLSRISGRTGKVEVIQPFRLTEPRGGILEGGMSEEHNERAYAKHFKTAIGEILSDCNT